MKIPRHERDEIKEDEKNEPPPKKSKRGKSSSAKKTSFSELSSAPLPLQTSSSSQSSPTSSTSSPAHSPPLPALVATSPDMIIADDPQMDAVTIKSESPVAAPRSDDTSSSIDAQFAVLARQLIAHTVNSATWLDALTAPSPALGSSCIQLNRVVMCELLRAFDWALNLKPLDVHQQLRERLAYVQSVLSLLVSFATSQLPIPTEDDRSLLAVRTALYQALEYRVGAIVTSLRRQLRENELQAPVAVVNANGTVRTVVEVQSSLRSSISESRPRGKAPPESVLRTIAMSPGQLYDIPERNANHEWIADLQYSHTFWVISSQLLEHGQYVPMDVNHLSSIAQLLATIMSNVTVSADHDQPLAFVNQVEHFLLWEQVQRLVYNAVRMVTAEFASFCEDREYISETVTVLVFRLVR